MRRSNYRRSPGKSRPPDPAHGVGDPLAVGIVPYREAQSEEDVGAHHPPSEHVQIFVAEAATDFAFVTRGDEARRNACRRRLIMLAVDLRVDEFGLVDDAVDVAVIANEAQEGLERATLTVKPVCCVAERRPDIVADLRRHVANERPEQRLLGFEICVEGAKRDAGALGNADDRAGGKTVLAKFLARGVEDLAQGAPPPPRAPGLRTAGGAKLAPILDLYAHSGPPTAQPFIRKLKHGST